MKKLFSVVMALAMVAVSSSSFAGVQSDSGVASASGAVGANSIVWNGINWNGMGWNGVGWNGSAWNGIQVNGSAPPNPLHELGQKPLLVMN